MTNDEVQVCDFTRSYLRWTVDTTKQPVITASQKPPMTLNHVRMPIECRTLITEEATGRAHEFFLGTSCKSEQVWVKSGVWHQPNADMLMWASRDQFVIFKRWDKADKGVMLHPPTRGVQPERQLGDPREAFDRFAVAVTQQRGRVLENLDDILKALSCERLVVSQTEYRAAGCRVLIEYPVKTVNYSERERYYQVDTGPVLLPDFSNPRVSLIEGCRLAYVAHNCPGWAEFIVNVPTPLTDTIKVHHYAKSERVEGTMNRLIVLQESN